MTKDVLPTLDSKAFAQYFGIGLGHHGEAVATYAPPLRPQIYRPEVVNKFIGAAVGII